MSLAHLGRFAEAAEHEAEAIRLAEPTHHAFTVGLAHCAAGMLHLLKGDWAKARSLIEHGIAVVRAGNVVLLLPWAVASSAWVLAQLGEASEALNRLREGEQLLERQAARGLVGHRGWAHHSLGRAVSAARPARRGAEPGRPRGRILPGSPRVRGPCAAPARRHRDPSRPVRCRARRGPLPPRRWRSPSRAACAPSSPTATSASASSTGARASASRPSEHLTTATTMYREMDMAFWLEQAEAEMKELA